MAARRGGKTGPPALSLRDRRLRQREELRAQVLAAARAIITSEGPRTLSMRKLAEHLDCSPMSLYSYFEDKHALLLALAHQRFDALARRLEAGRAPRPLDALRELYLAYARLGFDEPDDYRIIFMTPETQPARERKAPADIYRENPAFAVSLDRVRTCLDTGELSGDAHAIATMLWTTVHGAVSAILNFPAFPFGDAEAYVDRVVDWAIGAVRAVTMEPLRKEAVLF